MKNNLMVFNNENFGDVRVLSIEGEPWFVGKDVGEKLGYKNISDALKVNVEEEDRLQIAYNDLQKYGLEGFGTKGGVLINESGLYSLILSSKLPTAKKFKHWVTSEILPTIRKTGSYGVPQLTQEQELQLRILNGANGLERTVALAEYKEFIEKPLLEEIQDKQEFIDDVVGCNGECIMVGEFAKLTKPRYGLGQNKLFEALRELNILRYHNKCNVPYQRFLDAGYFEVRETNKNGHIKMVTMITVKGQQYLKKRLDKWSKDKEESIQRRIEQEENYGVKHYFK